MSDPRRHIPRTDELLQMPQVAKARHRLAEHVIRREMAQVLELARSGKIPADKVKTEVARRLENRRPYSLRPVINATGVVIHTNLGRAPLADAAIAAMRDAAGYTDVELDLATGRRSSDRGRGAIEALRAACPAAEDALVVNNGAAALLLATAALAPGKEVVISRGELIEIGAGFRLPELIESTSTRLKEVGATNRTHLQDYEWAIGPETGAVLKVHPSNFRIEGFTAAVGVPELRELTAERGVSLIVDLGSGLLNPDSQLPVEPDLQAQLTAGADVVIASGDKLLGGPQAGIVLGASEAIAKIKRHPLARAVRIDKVRLNALEASLNAATNAASSFIHLDQTEYRARTEAIARACGGELVEHAGRVGGGGAPEYPLPGFAVAFPETLAQHLRAGNPPVLPRVHQGACLIDVRCVPQEQDEALITAIREAL